MAKNKKYLSTIETIIGFLMAFFVIWGLAKCEEYKLTKKNTPNNTPPLFTESTALSLCRDAIRTAARDPDKAEIPYIEPLSFAKVFVFRWDRQTSFLRLRNGLGLDVATTGSCTVDKDLKMVTQLILDDKIIFSFRSEELEKQKKNISPPPPENKQRSIAEIKQENAYLIKKMKEEIAKKEAEDNSINH